MCANLVAGASIQQSSLAFLGDNDLSFSHTQRLQNISENTEPFADKDSTLPYGLPDYAAQNGYVAVDSSRTNT
jgi:hypothetical protein